MSAGQTSRAPAARVLATVGLLMGLLTVGLLTVPPVPARAAAGPAASAVACDQESADGPGHDAQTLAGSVPVLFVHGMASGPGVWSAGTDSLGAQVAGIAGATSWAFDYSSAALDWVTDPRIGPALANAISCLARTSGHRVIIVAHSMGGLATQDAVAQPDPNGGLVAQHVAEVVTLGTPFLGSAMLSVAQNGIDSLESTARRFDQSLGTGTEAAIVAELSGCAKLAAPNNLSNPCGIESVFGSPVGTALEYESDQIGALPAWPTGLPVLPIAGAIDLRVGVSKLAVDLPLGDGVVTLNSATAHHTAGVASIQLTCHGVGVSELAASPCNHVNLERNPAVGTAVRAVVRDHLPTRPTGRSAVTVVRLDGNSRVVSTALGPDGRIWVLTASTQLGPDALQIVDPATHSIAVDHLPDSGPGGTFVYGTAMAFDGDGDLWLPATVHAATATATAAAATPGGAAPGPAPTGDTSDVLMKFAFGIGTPTPYPFPADCLTGAGLGAQAGLAAADGAVWLTCPSKTSRGAASAFARLTSDDSVTPAHVVLQGQPGDLIYLGSEELPMESFDGAMAPGPGGVMWYLPSAGVVELRPDGSELLHLPPGGGVAGPGHPVVGSEFQIFGNGRNSPAELSTCETDNAGVSGSAQCFVNLSPSGDAQTLRTLLPDYDGYNTLQTAAATMDMNGDLWTWFKGTAGGRAPGGNYYVRSSGGGTTVFPFSVPSTDPAQPVTLSMRAPVITADGGLWTDGMNASTPVLVEVTPRD